jgi:hypothetical protein
MTEAITTATSKARPSHRSKTKVHLQAALASGQFEGPDDALGRTELHMPMPEACLGAWGCSEWTSWILPARSFPAGTAEVRPPPRGRAQNRLARAIGHALSQFFC